MRSMRIQHSLEIRLLLTILCVCHFAHAISIHLTEHAVTTQVQGSVLFSVDIACTGVPTIQWTFTSVSGQRCIASWQPGGFANISAFYEDRIHTHPNGSLTLSHARLQDTGYYVITVTEPSGNSRDGSLLLHVTEVLYEDLQYLAVFAIVLGGIAAILMLSMWLLSKIHHRVKAWRGRRRLPEHTDTELQPL